MNNLLKTLIESTLRASTFKTNFVSNIKIIWKMLLQLAPFADIVPTKGYFYGIDQVLLANPYSLSLSDDEVLYYYTEISPSG